MNEFEKFQKNPDVNSEMKEVTDSSVQRVGTLYANTLKKMYNFPTFQTNMLQYSLKYELGKEALKIPKPRKDIKTRQDTTSKKKKDDDKS